MSFWQVIVLFILVVVVTAAVDMNTTICNTRSPNVDAKTRTCSQQCLNPTNSSCELSCKANSQVGRLSQLKNLQFKSREGIAYED